jgi:hypothetical protein
LVNTVQEVARFPWKPVYSCQPANEEDIVASMVRNSARLRRALAVGTGSMIAVATLLPSSAAAERPADASGPGMVNNTTTALSGGDVEPGDLISSGWAMSLPGRHPAATVRLTGIMATIPLRCDGEKGDEEDGTSSIVLRFPDASQSIAANDTSWHPTTAPADAQGYQVTVAVGALCHGGASEPRGDVSYQAMLKSTDTRDPFLLRFHTVDARSRSSEVDDHQSGANIDCSSTTANVHGLEACSAPWTPATRLVAAALSLVPTPLPVPRAAGAHGSGGSGNQPPAQLGSIPGTLVGPPAAGAPPASAPAPATPALPVLVLPAPSQPTVLSPVPLVVPVIDGVDAQVAGAIPWKWYVFLAIIDLGLIVGLVIRRRRGVDRLGRH